MSDGTVFCYLCGKRYTPTAGATYTHTRHAQAPLNVTPSADVVTGWLELCQQERDDRVRELWGW